jgi:hypothetical protein
MTFQYEYEKFIDTYSTVEQKDISFMIWLIENPKSPFHLHGSASLKDHDAIHVLLECGQSNDEEAFVIGFTMGTDDRIKPWEVKIFKFISRFLYPKKNRFTKAQIEIFDIGFKYGNSRNTNRIGEVDWTKYNLDVPLKEIQLGFGIMDNELSYLKRDIK